MCHSYRLNNVMEQQCGHSQMRFKCIAALETEHTHECMPYNNYVDSTQLEAKMVPGAHIIYIMYS